MTLLKHWVNGIPDVGLPVTDRALSFGDSLFETFRIHRGRAHLWPRHLARLERGLAALAIDCSLERVAQQLDQACDWLLSDAVDDAAARLTVSRGPAERGYRGRAGPPTVILQLFECSAWRSQMPAARVVVCETRLAEQPLLAGIKHGNRLEQVLAGLELDAHGADDGVLCNSRGELVCALASNLFMVRDEQLITPAIEGCGIAGTVRELIIEELAERAGIPVQVGRLLPEDLATADELFLTSSLQGIRSVAACDELSFTSTRWGDNLRHHFQQACDTTT